jgi:hypothetical protein
MHNGSRSLYLLNNLLTPFLTDLMMGWKCPREFIGSWKVYS